MHELLRKVGSKLMLHHTVTMWERGLNNGAICDTFSDSSGMQHQRLYINRHCIKLAAVVRDALTSLCMADSCVAGHRPQKGGRCVLTTNTPVIVVGKKNFSMSAILETEKKLSRHVYAICLDGTFLIGRDAMDRRHGCANRSAQRSPEYDNRCDDCGNRLADDRLLYAWDLF